MLVLHAQPGKQATEVTGTVERLFHFWAYSSFFSWLSWLKYKFSERIRPFLYFQCILKTVYTRELTTKYTHLHTCKDICVSTSVSSFDQKVVILYIFGKCLTSEWFELNLSFLRPLVWIFHYLVFFLPITYLKTSYFLEFAQLRYKSIEKIT